MAELVIECPTPDGHRDFSNTSSTRNEPQTNLRIREFLKMHHEYQSPAGSADSGNSSDEQQRRLANHSPPPNCSICLGRIKSKCFTDSCMHQFCFSCLLEWSKVKPECPLCKQTFKSIIHNVTSMDNYEEYRVEAHQRHVNWYNLPFQPSDVDMNFLISASLPSAILQRPEHLARGTDMVRRRLHQLFNLDSPLVQRFAQTYPDEIYPARISGSQWRSYIYNRRLFAEPLNDLGGQSRDISAEFYRANPAQIHRLVPWLNRELMSICTDQPQTISFVVQGIEQLIQRHDMTSLEFASRIRALVPNHTNHFIHELINYARSPYDLIGYDRFVSYLPRFGADTTDVVTLSSSEEGSDVEYVGYIGGVETVDGTASNSVQVRTDTSSTSNNNETISISNRNETIEQPGASTSRSTLDALDGLITNVSDDSDEEEIGMLLLKKPKISAKDQIRGRTGPSPTNSQSTSTHESTANDSAETDRECTVIVAPTNVQPSEASTSQASDVILGITPKIEPQTTTVDNSGSDSDECLFVCAKKPPHLRTPEYVELNSDSDSDVVFVSQETCEMPMADITNNHLDAVADMRKSVLSALVAAQNSETNASAKRKRSRATDTNSTGYSRQPATARVYSGKPSTSEAMLQWLIQPPEDSSRRISPRSSARRQPSPVRPRLTTTIKLSRGKRIYESPSSESGSTDSEEGSSTSSSESYPESSDEASSHEEYVCNIRPRPKESDNSDGPSLNPRKRFRKRRGKRLYGSSAEDEASEAD